PLDSCGPLLRRQVSRREGEIHASAVPALRRRAVRAGLPGLRDLSQQRGAERTGLQPLRGDAVLRKQLPVLGAVLQLLCAAVAGDPRVATQPRRCGADGRRDGEVYVLRAADPAREGRRQAGGPAGEGWRSAASLRAVVAGGGDDFRRLERSGEQGLAAGGERAGDAAARKLGDEAEGVLFAASQMKERKNLNTQTPKTPRHKEKESLCLCVFV